MRDSSYWRIIAGLFVAALLYIGDSLHFGEPLNVPSLMPSAHASVGVANENSETLFTASADGRKIYMWQYFSSKPPKFLGEAEAVLSE